ncbi:uncharacterized protein LOC118767588 isoform X1 [Octopus sinensis]|uniref:Uncharacterized protein LOC118767588 isoform X1 n=1 Tax=Octopus sinensis TaxID=2607531 RepID=A0A7E6FLI1_9MOLL|nr:uncharacterized protein LOC118767588 isoform X1 [Octopus sinensis]XP_036368270.1 uncharacterized protein LOC118767588 isoform X1 [Octopus sinensis]XP_036368272.1 uncharacterized protein LOC118767588 isoform X1 [Octopus sinensis]
MATPYRLPPNYMRHQGNSGRHFVGRHYEREELKILINDEDTQIIQVYGLPYVGKTSLVKTVCEELKDEINPERLHIKHIHISNNSSWSDISNMYNTFTNCSSIINTKWKFCIFDDFQNIQESFLQGFQELCDNGIPLHRNLKIILILSGGKPFQFDGIRFGKCKVSPLSIGDAQLLFGRCSDIETNDENKKQIHNIIRYACGLPGLLIYFAEKFSQFRHNFSFDDIYKMICDETKLNDWLDECTINRRNIKQEMDKYFSQLSLEQQEAIKVLSYFPGRFGIEEAVEMTGSSSQPASKMHVLMPLVEQGLISSDLELQNFQVQELIRAITKQQIDNVHSNDLVKLRYTNIIGKSLMKAQDIYDKGLIYEALGIMKNNWENISFLMKKGIEAPSDGRTYGVYYEITLKASNILMLCHPRDSRQFFQACLQNSLLFGNEEEQAFMNIAYGVSLTDLPGYGGYKEAMEHYKKALDVLKSRNIQYRQVLLYNSMADNAHMRGNHVEALNFAEMGYNMTVNDASPQMVQDAKIKCASALAYNLSFVGYYDKCEKILTENLKKTSGLTSPVLSKLLNTMGVNYERNGSQYNKAIKFYNAALSERLKIVTVNPNISVISYSNVANLLSRNFGKHSKALQLLFSAKDIQKKHRWLHMNTSLVLHYIGYVYLRMHEISNSLTYFHGALDIYNQIHPNYTGKMNIIHAIAHCYLLKEEFDKAKSCFKDMLEGYSDRLLSGSSEAESLSLALEHMVYLNLENPQNQLFHLENLLNEIRQLLKRSVNEKQKLRYSNAIAKYHSLKLLLLDKLNQNEERAGLLMDSIPVLCIYCKNFRQYLNCSQENYIHKVCGLRSNLYEIDIQQRLKIVE